MKSGEMVVKIQNAVVMAVNKASAKLNIAFPYPVLSFDLRGTFAGKAYSPFNYIRFNLDIALDNPEEFVRSTVPHEVCHCICYLYYGKRCCHGKEWRIFMATIYGLFPHRCHKFDVSKHRKRASYLYKYKCNCGELNFRPKHHKLLSYGAKLRCPKCGSTITRNEYQKKFDRYTGL